MMSSIRASRGSQYRVQDDRGQHLRGGIQQSCGEIFAWSTCTQNVMSVSYARKRWWDLPVDLRLGNSVCTVEAKTHDGVPFRAEGVSSRRIVDRSLGLTGVLPSGCEWARNTSACGVVAPGVYFYLASSDAPPQSGKRSDDKSGRRDGRHGSSAKEGAEGCWAALSVSVCVCVRCATRGRAGQGRRGSGKPVQVWLDHAPREIRDDAGALATAVGQHMGMFSVGPYTMQQSDREVHAPLTLAQGWLGCCLLAVALALGIMPVGAPSALLR